MSNGYAAIDCGTNSTRLLAVDSEGNVLIREYVVTRLGQGVDATKTLSEDAIKRTVGAVASFKTRLDEHGIDRIAIFTTSAARDATNSETFFSSLEQLTGLRPTLLSGKEEGTVTYLGAVSGLHDGPYLVVDIGGGSTELVARIDGEVVAASLDIGAVRLKERFLHSDPFLSAELEVTKNYVRQLIEDQIDADWFQGLQMVAVAGTATNLAMMNLGLTHYEPGSVHGHTMTSNDLNSLVERLVSATQAQRLADPTIEPARADVLPAGALILGEIVARLDAASVLISETDNLDGAVAQLRTARS